MRRPPTSRVLPFLTSYGTSYGITILNAFLGVLIARSLGVADRGVLTYVQQVTNTLIGFADLGLGTLVVIAAARQGVRKAVESVTGFAVAGGLAFGIAGAAFVVFQTKASLNVPLICLAVIVAALTAPVTKVLTGALRGAGQTSKYAFVAASVPLVFGAVLVGYAASFKITVAVVIAAQAAATLIAFALAHLLSLGRVVRPGNLLRATGGGASLRSGLGMLVGAASPLDFMNVDLLLVAFLLSPVEGGKYTVLVSLASLVKAQASAASVVLLGRYSAGDESRRASRAVSYLAAGSAALGIPVAIILIPVVYGPQFGSPWEVVLAVLAASWVSVVKVQHADRLRAAGRGSTVSIIEGVGVVQFVSVCLAVGKDALTVSVVLVVTQAAIAAAYLAIERRGRLVRR